MNIFSEVKNQISSREVAEYYGLKINRSGMACCPFHNDKHPSMKIDKNYHCFACGVGGDVIDYVSRMFGLSQYYAEIKIIEDFSLPVDTKGTVRMSAANKKFLQEKKKEQERIIRIKKRFHEWCQETIDLLKAWIAEIHNIGEHFRTKFLDMIFSDEYVQMIHAVPLMEYWLDILCLGVIEDKQELFLKERKVVDRLVKSMESARNRIMERNRGSA